MLPYIPEEYEIVIRRLHLLIESVRIGRTTSQVVIEALSLALAREIARQRAPEYRNDPRFTSDLATKIMDLALVGLQEALDASRD